MNILRILSGPTTVLKMGVWSNVVSSGVEQLVCMRLSWSWSTLEWLMLLLDFWRALASPGGSCYSGWALADRVGDESLNGFFNRKWYLFGIPIILWLKWRADLELI